VEALAASTASVAGWRVLMMLTEHEIAHRALLTTYAGMNGWPVHQIFDRTKRVRRGPTQRRAPQASMSDPLEGRAFAALLEPSYATYYSSGSRTEKRVPVWAVLTSRQPPRASTIRFDNVRPSPAPPPDRAGSAR
jgi:hypothetical protein